MANIKQFEHWFTTNFFEREKFDADAAIGFQDIQDATAGWAANGLMYMLNNALDCLEGDEQYLEVGTYGGRSLIGALRNNDCRAQVIDPFANTVPGVRKGFESAIDAFQVRDRITLHEEFIEKFDADLPPIGVFFYDGNHDSGHTYEGLVRCERYLADRAIIIVDDIYIPGGGGQTAFPGHSISYSPVKTDVTRWLKENQDRASLLAITPWTFQQAVICYERK